MSTGVGERSRLSSRTWAMIALAATTAAWGMVPLVLKQTRMPTLAFASWRLAFGAIIYQIALPATGRRLRWSTIRSCWLGGVLFGTDVALSFGAFRLTTVANATIIGALSPVVIALGAVRLFGERIERRDAVLVVVSFAGVALVALGSTGSADWSPVGDALAAISLFSWSSYWLFSKRMRRRGVSALEYMATVMLVAAICVTTVSAASGVSLAPPRGIDWMWIWLLVLVPGGTGHLLVAWSHRHVEAWAGSLITQGQPVVGSVAAWALLGESLTPLVVVGGLVVLAATAVIAVRESRRAPTDDGLEPFPAHPSGG